MAVSKGYEIDERAWTIIKENMLDFKKYIPTLQDQKVYERKLNEYLNKSRVDIKEKVSNGRADDTAGSGSK